MHPHLRRHVVLLCGPSEIKATAHSTARCGVSAAGCSDVLKADIDGYDRYFDENRDDKLTTRLVTTVTDTYNEATTNAEVRHSSVCDYLVNWHISEYTEPEEVETKFDPFDETQVDLSGLVNAKEQEEPAE